MKRASSDSTAPQKDDAKSDDERDAGSETGTKSGREVVGTSKNLASRPDNGDGAEEELEDGKVMVQGYTFAVLETMDLPAFVREHNTTLTFPQKLMLMLMHMDKIFAKSGKKPDQAPIGWVNNGLAFYIRDKNELVNKWLPIFFRQAKFSSFTRKLYRWGFRQVNTDMHDGSETPMMFFGSESFQRDKKGLMCKMRSITAASRRREEQFTHEEEKTTVIAAPAFNEGGENSRQLIQSRLAGQQLPLANLSQMASQTGLFGLNSLGGQSELLFGGQLYPLFSAPEIAAYQQQQFHAVGQRARCTYPLTHQLGQTTLAAAAGINLPLLLQQQRRQRQLQFLQQLQQHSLTATTTTAGLEEHERLRLMLDALTRVGDVARSLGPS